MAEMVFSEMAPGFAQVKSQTRTTLKHIRRARYATSIAGPRLNSNFDRMFDPMLKTLSSMLSAAVNLLNKSLENLNDNQAREFITGIGEVYVKTNEVLRGCESLGLHRNSAYAATLANIEYANDHLLAIVEGLQMTDDPEFVKLVHAAVVEVQEISNLGPMHT